MSPDETRAFLRENHRGVLVTRRADGGVQTSPVTVGLDGDGMAVISTRESAYKVRNLRRDPTAVVCTFADQFFGRPWVQVEGRASILSLPEAMEPLVEYYRSISGEHPDWDEYRQAMETQRRVLVRIPLEKVGPSRFG